MCNYADDTSFHACELNLESLVKKLEHDLMLTIGWFGNNIGKGNKGNIKVII